MSTAAQTTAFEETRRHVELLRGGLPEELITPLWSLQGKSSYSVKTPAAAAALALPDAGIAPQGRYGPRT